MIENEQKSTELLFWSWGHDVDKKVGVIKDLVYLIKLYLSNQPPNLDTINTRLDMITKISSEIAKTPLPFNVEQISVNLLIQELVERLQTFNRYEDVKFKIDLVGEPQIVANSVWLVRAFDELFENAVEAMSETENKEIAITSQISDNKVTILVKDSGRGIGREQLSEILIEPPTLRADGKGRGLYIIRLTIELYGGHIKMNTSSSGTIISISLPISSELG